MTVKIKKVLAMVCLLLCGTSTALAERVSLAELELEQNGAPVKYCRSNKLHHLHLIQLNLHP